MNYTIYDPTTGAISGHYSFTAPELIEDNLNGKSYIEGKYNHIEYYIVNNAPVLKPEDPSSATVKYVFDYTTKNWIVEQALTIATARKQRNQLLYAIDKINPIWYSTLSDQQKTDLVAYRQALLDVPQQQGFPITIMWPTKPEWL